MEIKRSVLLPYSAQDMFDLIEQAEHYPQFLPWCVHTSLLERSDDWVAARIDFKYLQVRFSLQTRNPKRRPEWLKVRMVQGPFRHFHADWLLTPLGAGGLQGCRVNFDLAYEVSDGLLDRVAAKAVEIVARSMMDAFVKRAEQTLPMASERPPMETGAPPVIQVAVAALAVPDDVLPLAPAQSEPVAASAATPAAASAAAVEAIAPAETAFDPAVPVPAGPPLEAPPEPTSQAAPGPAPDPSPHPTPEPTPDPLPAQAEGTPAAWLPAAGAPEPLERPLMSTLDPDLLKAVRDCPLSAELDEQQVSVLAGLMQLKAFAAREVLAPEDQTDNRLCVIVEGELAAIKSFGSPDESLLVTFKPGAFAHELGFLDGATRYASLVALMPSRVLLLEREALETLIHTQPLVLYRVMCAIVRAVHRIQTRLSVQTSELTNYIVKQHGRY